MKHKFTFIGATLAALTFSTGPAYAYNCWRGDLDKTELRPEGALANKFRIDGHIIGLRQTITQRLDIRRAGDRFDIGQTVQHVLANHVESDGGRQVESSPL